MKRLKNVTKCISCMAAALVLCVMSGWFTQEVFAETGYGEKDGIIYLYDTETGEAFVDGYTGEDADFVIPETIDGYTVKSVSLYNDKNIKTISIPSGVTSCYFVAQQFEYVYVDEANQTYKSVDGALYTKDGKELIVYPCKEYKDVVIPEGTETIWDGAMSKTVAETVSLPGTLKNIYISLEDDEEYYQPAEIYSAEVLPDSEKLKDVYVSEANGNIVSVDGIVYSKDMKRLVFCPAGKDGEITVDERVEIIGHQAFYKCNCTAINLPEGLKNIEYSAFGKCANLTELKIPDSITDLDKDMFRYSGLKTLLFSENSPYISENGILYSKDKSKLLFAFGDISGRVVIPEGVQVIGSEAFSGDDEISAVQFPKSLLSIEKAAFEYCTRIQKLVIPENVTSIGDSAFFVTILSDVYIESTVLNSVGYDAFWVVVPHCNVTVKNEEIAELIRKSLMPDDDSVSIIVEKPVEPVKLDKSAVTLYTGNYKNTETVKATLNGITGNIKWTTSNKAVATVKNGKITAVGKGTAVIKATVGENTVQVKVTVKNPTVIVADGSKTVNSIKIKKSKTAIYKVKVNPAKSKVSIIQDAKSKKTAKVTYKNNILSVKGLKKGTAEIKIKCGAGVKKLKVTVK